MQVDLSADHFALFGLERAFRVDEAELRARYRRLQQALHPDRFAAAPAAERRWSVQAASRVNDAYATLREPLARAVYLLSLDGVALDEETDTAMAPDFLMEQMALREALESVPRAEVPSAALAGIDKRLDALERTVSDAFEQAFGASDTAAARDAARRWQFVERLRREARESAARLERGDR